MLCHGFAMACAAAGTDTQLFQHETPPRSSRATTCDQCADGDHEPHLLAHDVRTGIRECSSTLTLVLALIYHIG